MVKNPEEVASGVYRLETAIARLGELQPRVVATGHGPPLKGDPFVTFPLVRQHG